MGYSRNEAKVQVYLLFKQGAQKLEFTGVNHYLVDTFFILLRESQFPNYNGQQSSVNVNLGKGSYVVNDKHDKDGDPFGFIAGKNALVKVVPAVTVDTGAPGAKYTAAENGDAVLTKTHGADQLPTNLNEYGYGFWMRYLTTFPVR